jgi:hypothetical protein
VNSFPIMPAIGFHYSLSVFGQVAFALCADMLVCRTTRTKARGRASVADSTGALIDDT